MAAAGEILTAAFSIPGHFSEPLYGLVVIGWGIASPDKPVRFQELVWNEDRQELVDLTHKWADSPYKGAEFDGWSPDEVVCAICEWFIRRKPG
ncbi:hypothetical protein BHS57_22425 [Salmonella enterica]|nr:hypothetical protein [Salmonella enterica]ECB3799817.1 hypothetical protein [Salmonella enterica subsp. enterica serovar Typhimurium]